MRFSAIHIVSHVFNVCRVRYFRRLSLNKQYTILCEEKSTSRSRTTDRKCIYIFISCCYRCRSLWLKPRLRNRTQKQRSGAAAWLIGQDPPSKLRLFKLRRSGKTNRFSVSSGLTAAAAKREVGVLIIIIFFFSFCFRLRSRDLSTGKMTKETDTADGDGGRKIRGPLIIRVSRRRPPIRVLVTRFISLL